MKRITLRALALRVQEWASIAEIETTKGKDDLECAVRYLRRIEATIRRAAPKAPRGAA